MYVILGASGNTGHIAAKTLLSRRQDGAGRRAQRGTFATTDGARRCKAHRRYHRRICIG